MLVGSVEVNREADNTRERTRQETLQLLITDTQLGRVVPELEPPPASVIVV